MLNLPKLIGHRGDKDLSPENTIDSIKLAKKFGLHWVEVDVKITKDLIPIILHDDSLERTTNGVGLPIDYHYKDLRRLDAGINFYNHKTEIYIPTFEEILFLSKNENISLNIELKPNTGFEKQNVEYIAKIIKKTEFLNNFYFSSFDWNSLTMMKEILPDANYSVLVDEFKKNSTLDNMIKISKKYNFFCCGLNINIVTPEVVKEILKNNLKITVYSEKNITVHQAKELWSKGVDSIFIDDPRNFEVD